MSHLLSAIRVRASSAGSIRATRCCFVRKLSISASLSGWSAWGAPLCAGSATGVAAVLAMTAHGWARSREASLRAAERPRKVAVRLNRLSAKSRVKHRVRLRVGVNNSILASSSETGFSVRNGKIGDVELLTPSHPKLVAIAGSRMSPMCHLSRRGMARRNA